MLFVSHVPCFASGGDSRSARIDALSAAFLAHLDALGPEYAIASATVRDGWERLYRERMPDGFVPDALAVLYADYRAALEAYDAGRFAEAAERFEPLAGHGDPYVAANAEYYGVRALIELGRFEEGRQRLADAPQRSARLERYTPYAPHLLLLLAVCEARTLRYEPAVAALDALHERFREMPESVAVGARQLRIEIERREDGSLDDVSTVMTYVADRLGAEDPGERTQERQEQIIAMLDALIEEMEQQEQQSGGSGRARRGSAQPQPSGGRPAEHSEAPEGAAQIGDLQAAPRIEPGEMWGKLPPAEREKILQAIRERFPSRYRELVEQYYRALAEEK